MLEEKLPEHLIFDITHSLFYASKWGNTETGTIVWVQWSFSSVTGLTGKIFVKVHGKKWKEKKKRRNEKENTHFKETYCLHKQSPKGTHLQTNHS